MHDIERRAFMKGAAMGALAFTVGGAKILLTAREARAQGVPFRLLKADEAETLEALGETLVPGARAAGIAHFVDQQLSVPPEEALLEARILNVKPPYANFYRAAIGAIDRAERCTIEIRIGRADVEDARFEQRLLRRDRDLLIDEVGYPGLAGTRDERLPERVERRRLRGRQRPQRNAL